MNRAARSGSGDSQSPLVLPHETILNEALRYLEQVQPWSVIPVGDDKKPIGSWKAWQSRVMTTEQAKGYFTSRAVKGLAVVCGAVSNVTVLDFEQGSLELPEVQAILELAKSVPRARSGGGGVHLFFASSGERNKPLELQGVHVGDVRGEGGYIVLPPSAHPSGNTYQWELESSNNLEPNSEALRMLLEQFNQKVQIIPKPVSISKTATRAKDDVPSNDDAIRKYVLAALKNECNTLRNAPEGMGNDQINKSAFALGQFVGVGVISESEVRDALEQVINTWAKPDPKAAASIRSGLEAGKLEPRDLSEVGKKPLPEVWTKIRDGKDSSKKAKPESGDGLPEIAVNNRYLRDISSDAVQALQKANNPTTLFYRGEALVRVTPNTVLKAESLTHVSLKSILERTANFCKIEPRAVKDEDGKPLKDNAGKVVTNEEALPARVPNDLPADILSQPLLPFPKLEALAQTPIYAPNRTLVMQDGFNQETGFYLRLENLQGVRCDMPLSDARALLLEDCLGDFPFADARAGRAHAVALLLQPFIRNMIHGATPLYLIEAPTRGTGKGLLSDVVNIIASGGVAGVMFLPKDGAELEKRITAALLDGARVLLLDNVITLEGEALAAALTARQWKGRILGRSQMVQVPNDATWIATGNNVTLDDDMPRRIIPIRLDPQMERPEARDGFRHPDLRAWVSDNRTALVSACLSIVEAWKAQGCPVGREKLGTYEAWCAVMGGILEVAGIHGLLEAREYLYTDSNHEPEEWGAVLKTLYLEREGRSFTAKDFFAVAKQHQLLLDIWGGREGVGALQRVGRAMTKNRDRVFAGYRLRSAGIDSVSKSNAYRIERTGGNNSNKTPETPVMNDSSVYDDESLRGFMSENPRVNPRNPEQNPRDQTNDFTGVSTDQTRNPVENPVTRMPSSTDATGISGGFGGFIPTTVTSEAQFPKLETIEDVMRL